MNEHGEGKLEHEISQAELADQINGSIDELWQRYGWKCQKEIVWRKKSEKPPERIARVLQRPRSLDDENEKFVLAIFGTESADQRQRISEIINFLIPHEVAHAVAEENQAQYETELPSEQFADLKTSRQITPELFYSGANELAADVVGYRLAVDSDRQDAFSESLVAHLQDDMQRQRAAELEPFYRDQARFETLISYLEKQGVDFKDNERLHEVLDFWQATRGQALEADDQRRYQEMCDYLKLIADKSQHIPLTAEKTK